MQFSKSRYYPCVYLVLHTLYEQVKNYSSCNSCGNTKIEQSLRMSSLFPILVALLHINTTALVLDQNDSQTGGKRKRLNTVCKKV